MSCEEVLRSVLDLFGAILTFYNGYWVVCKPNLLADNDSLTFWHYDSNGVFVPPTGKKTIDFSVAIGSQINDFYPHHVNSNQQKTIKNSVGAFRVLYSYGLVKSFFSNIYLENILGVIDEWSFVSGSISFPVDNLGVIIDSTELINTTSIMQSDSFTLEAGNRIRFRTVFKKNDINENLNALFQVILTNGVDTYYLDINGSWSTNSLTRIDIEALSAGSGTFNVDSFGLPINGDVSIEIFRPYNDFDDNSITIYECGYSPLTEQEKKGEIITLERESKPSPKISKTKEVFNNSDLNSSDTYYGTIYQSDKVTPVTVFKRKTPARTLPLIYLMAEERMKMYSKPTQIYKGDLYGYFNYLSIIEIDGLTGRFIPINYEYNALTNITKVTLNEVLNTDIISDLDYTFTYDYGDVEDPTIKN